MIRDGSSSNGSTQVLKLLEYRKVNREDGKKMNAAKEEWTEEQCKNIEKGMMSGNSKEAYNIPKALIKIQQNCQQSSKIE